VRRWLEPAGGSGGPDGAEGVVAVTIAGAAIHDKQLISVMRRERSQKV